MPHSVSAKKRVRQTARRNARARGIKSAIRTYTKKVVAALEAKDAGQATEHFRMVTKKLDKAVKRGVIHRNTAARTKSRLARMVARMGASGT